MEKAIQVTFAPATATKGKRYVAKSDSAHVTTDYNPDLTDSANMRFAANALVREMNMEPANMLHGMKYAIQAGAYMPDGKSYVYIASIL
jgi:hypothetical protein